jgi:sortase (surface protein transpeptidase)
VTYPEAGSAEVFADPTPTVPDLIAPIPPRPGPVARPPEQAEASQARADRLRLARRRRRIARSAGITLFACGVLATSLGLGGWRLITHAVQGHSARQSGQSGQAGTGANGGSAGHGNLAVQASGSARRISSVRPGHHKVTRPEWLVIPAIGVSTNLIKLGLPAEHTLQVPPTAAIAGWYTKSPRPGELGASIIAGHIDSTLGPGVFYRLRDLRRGQYIYVIRANHTVAVFEVTGKHMYSKSSFPDSVIYGPVPDAELRLITCGGTFDYATGSYLSNVVVTAVLIR